MHEAVIAVDVSQKSVCLRVVDVHLFSAQMPASVHMMNSVLDKLHLKPCPRAEDGEWLEEGPNNSS